MFWALVGLVVLGLLFSGFILYVVFNDEFTVSLNNERPNFQSKYFNNKE